MRPTKGRPGQSAVAPPRRVTLSLSQHVAARGEVRVQRRSELERLVAGVAELDVGGEAGVAQRHLVRGCSS